MKTKSDKTVKKHNTKRFQTLIDNKTISVSDLTEEQAKQEICKLMILVEKLGSLSKDMQEEIEKAGFSV